MLPRIPPAAPEFVLSVDRFYQALMTTAAPAEEPGLGGRLLYAGEVDGDGRALLVAANIAGCASLAATDDLRAQKQAIRDGVADFLVNSLDEALRILKNEIRKRETVAVCMAAAPGTVEQEMRERGVIPDLLRKNASHSFSEGVLWWRVDSAPAQWLPKLDAMAMQCLGEGADFEIRLARRWLRQAPRYLGRLADGWRVLRCDADVAQEFLARAENARKSGEIAVGVEAGFSGSDEVIRMGS
jgi:Urocanase Rossmann-like domain